MGINNIPANLIINNKKILNNLNSELIENLNIFINILNKNNNEFNYTENIILYKNKKSNNKFRIKFNRESEYGYELCEKANYLIDNLYNNINDSNKRNFIINLFYYGDFCDE
jgi:hypothetical protein